MVSRLLVSVFACAIVSVDSLKLLVTADARDDPVCSCACCNVHGDKPSPEWGHIVDGHQLYGCGPIFASQIFSNRGFADCDPQFGREGQFCIDETHVMDHKVGVAEFCFNSCTPATLTPKGNGQECLPVTPDVIAKAPVAPVAATTTAVPVNSRILPLFRFGGRSAAAPAAALGAPTTEGAPSLTGQAPLQAQQSSTPQPVLATNATAISTATTSTLAPHCQCVEVEHPVGGRLAAACLDHLGDDPHSWCYVPLAADCEPAAIPDVNFPEYQRWHCNDTTLQSAPFEPNTGVLSAATSVMDDMAHNLEGATGSAAELITTTTRPLSWDLVEENKHCTGSIDLGPVTSATQCQQRASADFECGTALHTNGALCYCVPSGHTCQSAVSEDGNDVYMFRAHSGVVGSDVDEAVSANPEAEAGVQAAAMGTSAMDAVAADFMSR